MYIAIHDNMKRRSIESMKPQDIVVLLKLISIGKQEWTQLLLARELFMSQSEISESLSRSKFADLIVNHNQVNKAALFDFLKYGLPYVYPQKPGEIVRGIPTAHSALPLSNEIESEESYVWPYVKGELRGRSIRPLYPSVVNAVGLDQNLYALLALIDALRVGRAREKTLAIDHLKRMIC